MGNLNLINVAKETIEITKHRCYWKAGKKILLPDMNYKKVEVLNEAVLDDIQEKRMRMFSDDSGLGSGADFYLVDGDSFQVAHEFSKPLVMNFANAIHPGGGFLHGAVAQEEALCRCSTLYASISSTEAREMYEYNKMVALPCESDYMLLSPDVCVFRSPSLELLEQPYTVSVVTVPAPNRRGAARLAKQEVLDEVVKGRIRKMLYAAAEYGYKNLVLGAWGCGAFGNDTASVAGCFYEIFFEEGLEALFENVAFAILNDEQKLEKFEAVFGSKFSNYPATGPVQNHMSSTYYEAVYSFPVCNHVKELSVNNLGYTQGIMHNGIPFESELWENGNSKNVSFVLPDLYFSNGKSSSIRNGNIVGFRNCVERFNNGILTIGMVDNGQIEDFEELLQYIDLLKENDLVEYTGEVENGAGLRCIDVEGNDLVNIIITLEEGEEELAEVFLEFRDFPNYKMHNKIRVLKDGKQNGDKE